jgi:hypothetical protein
MELMQILFKTTSFEQKSEAHFLTTKTYSSTYVFGTVLFFIVVPNVVLTYRLHKPNIYWMQSKPLHYCNV